MVEKTLSLKEIREICLKEKDCIIMRNYRRISTRITRLVYKTGILPWQITLFSFAVAIIGAALLLFGRYGFLVAGAVLFQISFILDCVDGEIARINKTGTPFGAWFDARVDFYSVALVLGAAAIGQFFVSNDANFLLIAIPAIINFGMVSDVIGTRAAFVKKEALEPTVGLKKGNRVGHRGLSALIVTIGLLVSVFWMLAIFATIWAIIWIKMVFDFYRLVKKKGEEIRLYPIKK